MADRSEISNSSNRSNRAKLQGESIFSLALAVLGLFIVIVSLIIGFGTLKNPGSGLFPFIVGLLICIQNLIIVFKNESTGKSLPLDYGQIKILVRMIVTFMLWILLMPFLGYLPATFVIVFSFTKIMRLEGWKKPLLLSIGTTGLCYLLFDVLLYLDLPRGILG
jgi:putative tricarboxylic transport membrane protein